MDHYDVTFTRNVATAAVPAVVVGPLTAVHQKRTPRPKVLALYACGTRPVGVDTVPPGVSGDYIPHKLEFVRTDTVPPGPADDKDAV